MDSFLELEGVSDWKLILGNMGRDITGFILESADLRALIVELSKT